MLNNPGVYFNVKPFIDPRCKTPIEEIQAAVDGALSPAHAVKLRECMSHIDQLQSHRCMVEQDILRLSSPYEDELALIRTVPGCNSNPMTAITILSEIGADMSVFSTAKHHPEFKERYRRLKARRGHKKAIIAICRMLLNAIWNVLSKAEPYSPAGYLSNHQVTEVRHLTQKQALNLLKSRGYVITDEESA